MLMVKSGDVKMLGLLYERYKTWLFNFFYQMNKDTDLSEDLVQNVFVRLLKYKHTYTEDSKFVTWIFQIARNESHDHYRKNKKHNKSESIEDVAYKLSDQQNVQSEIEDVESIKLLHRAIDKLSFEKKEIIVLSKLRQLQYREIGKIIGCSEANARIKAHRAFKELKAMYLTMQN